MNAEVNDFVLHCSNCLFTQAHLPGISAELLGLCPNCGFLVTKESLKTIVSPEEYESAYNDLVENRKKLMAKYNEQGVRAL